MEQQINQQNLTNTPNALNNNASNNTMIGGPQTHSQDTVRFTTSGEINTARLTNDRNALDQYKAANDAKQRTIGSFLARPALVRTGKLPVQMGVFERINVMEELRKMLARMKLEGFYAFKSRARLQVVVNSQPFQTGLYQLSYTPFYDFANGDKHEAGFYAKFDKAQPEMRYLSGCPSVLLNIGASNMMELILPYIGENAFCDIQSGDFGTFHLGCLIPIRDNTNAPSCTYNIYLSFEDVETYATFPTHIAQSDITSDTLQQLLEMLKNNSNVSTTAPSQSEEAKQTEGGVVSNIAGTVSKVANSLTAIPGLADIAGPVSWISDGVGKVAKMFGFSKPHSEKASEPVWINPYKDFNHCDGVDHSTKLTVNTNQEIQVRDFGPVKEDEMHMNYILKHPTYFEVFDWKKGAPMKTLLYQVPIEPRSFCEHQEWAHNSKADWRVSHTFLSYLSYMFTYWTGTVRLTFTVAGNKFYSGRLRFVYTPEKPRDNVFDELQHTYSHIVDLRDANTFTVDCSYIHTTPWRRCFVDSPNYLSVYVETPLECTETVNDLLSITVHVSALDDFNFAGPIRPRGMPCNGVDFTKVQPDTETVELQGFTEQLKTQHAPANIPIINDIEHVDPKESHKLAIGDPITSLRTLSKRFCHNGFISWNTRCMLVRPFKPLSVQDNAHFTPTQFQPADYIDWITALYRFRSGGMRISVQGMDDDVVYVAHKSATEIVNDNDNDLWRLQYFGGIDKNLSPGILGQLEMSETFARAEAHHSPSYSMFPFNPWIQGHLQIEVPYYSMKAITKNDRIRFNIDVGSDGKTSLDVLNKTIQIDDTTDHDNIITIFRNNTEEKQITAYRAAADDFSCGFLLGPPATRYVRTRVP